MLVAMLLTSIAFSNEAPVKSVAQVNVDSLADRVVANTLAQNYGLAFKQADSIAQMQPAKGHFFVSMVALSRFDDLGDTLLLLRTLNALEKATFTHADDLWWESIRMFQLGYARSVVGNAASAAWVTRKAAKNFAQMNGFEAKSFAAIYEFYMAGATAWVPFKGDERPQLLGLLEGAAKKSRHYWPLFSTSLAWMYFDRKEYAKGLAIANMALQKAPNNPVFLQMKADMLFRLGKVELAHKIYVASEKSYAQRAKYSVRWWSAVGNLLRIEYALGNQAAVQTLQKEFLDPRFKVMRKWLPPSLLENLEDLNLLP